MTEGLDEFPEALKGRDAMPWDDAVDTPVWPWGDDAGKKLSEIPSKELVKKRNWLQARGDIPWVHEWVLKIDAVLTERAGE